MSAVPGAGTVVIGDLASIAQSRCWPSTSIGLAHFWVAHLDSLSSNFYL
jgi:hypothetical protein